MLYDYNSITEEGHLEKSQGAWGLVTYSESPDSFSVKERGGLRHYKFLGESNER